MVEQIIKSDFSHMNIWLWALCWLQKNKETVLYNKYTSYYFFISEKSKIQKQHLKMKRLCLSH